MNPQLQSSRLLPADGLGPLLNKRQLVQQETVGKIPEPLVQVTIRSVVRLGQKESPKQVLTSRVFALARQVLKELAGKKWKPSDTLMVVLRKQSANPSRRSEHGERHQ